MFPGKAFDQTRIGETFSTSLTVTEAHLVAEADGKMLVANQR